MVLQQAAHYQVVPLVLINLKGCPPTAQTQQLVQGIKVGEAGAAKAWRRTGVKLRWLACRMHTVLQRPLGGWLDTLHVCL